MIIHRHARSHIGTSRATTPTQHAQRPMPRLPRRLCPALRRSDPNCCAVLAIDVPTREKSLPASCNAVWFPEASALNVSGRFVIVSATAVERLPMLPATRSVAFESVAFS